MSSTLYIGGHAAQTFSLLPFHVASFTPFTYKKKNCGGLSAQFLPPFGLIPRHIDVAYYCMYMYISIRRRRRYMAVHFFYL